MGCCDEETALVPKSGMTRSRLRAARCVAALRAARRRRRGRRAGLGRSGAGARRAAQEGDDLVLQPVPLRAALRGCARFRILQAARPRRRDRVFPRRQRRDPGAGGRRGRLRRDLARRRHAGLCQGRRHPPLRHHRTAAAVRRGDRAEDRRQHHRAQAPRRQDRRRVRARQRRPCADAVPAQAGRRRPGQGPVRDARRQHSRSAAPGPGRCRAGPGAGADAARQGRLARPRQRDGQRGRAEAPRRRLRIHGCLGAHQGDGGPPGRDAGAGARPRRRAQGDAARCRPNR